MYVCPPLLPLFSLLLVGREEDLQRNEAPSLQLLLPQHCCSQAAPQCRPALGTPWGSQEGAKATGGSTRKGK